ncbi:MAG: hypothetical protein R2795_16345 [Saprospiraceae bacterium]
MEQEGILHEGMDSLTIGTTFPYNVERQLEACLQIQSKSTVHSLPSAFSERWDYGIFPSRFIRGTVAQWFVANEQDSA